MLKNLTIKNYTLGSVTRIIPTLSTTLLSLQTPFLKKYLIPIPKITRKKSFIFKKSKRVYKHNSLILLNSTNPVTNGIISNNNLFNRLLTSPIPILLNFSKDKEIIKDTINPINLIIDFVKLNIKNFLKIMDI